MKKERGCIGSIWGFILTIGLLLIFATTLANAQAREVRIGASVSLTGNYAPFAALVKQGYEVWAEWINGRGGISVGGKPHKVEMIYYDDKSDAKTSAKLTEKLITEDRVNVILGPYSSGIAAATSAIGEKYRFVTIAPMANGDSLYKRGFKYLFSVLPVASRDYYPIVDLAVQQTPKPKTFAAVAMDHFYALPAIGGARQRSMELGLNEVYYGKFPLGTTDFSGILTALKSKQPDLLYFGGFFNESVSFYRQAKELNVNMKLITAIGTASHPNWPKVMKKDGEYLLSSQPWHRDIGFKGPFFTSESFDDFWKQKTGSGANFYQAGGFVAGILMQLAIERADILDQTKIRDAFSSMNVETFYGKFKYDAAGRNIAGSMGVAQVRNGKPVVVFPQRPEVKLVYPVPPWNER
ncbi:MAG: amino acid ABC transporter substrate-binding protein [Planctomycetota bacterium]|jgi:branched-chain amino acid transport system substrate-binding protein